MTNKEIAKQKVRELVEKFQAYPKSELDSMSEDQIKTWFIEPLFLALGWDTYDLFKEERVLKGRADYILKIGNQDKLVIEAKKTKVNLLEEQGRQAVSYAYHKNIKFSVLTNFKKIRVYHALSNIKNIDKNLLKDDKGYFWINCEDFVEQFDRLWLLSKESFENEKINELLKNVDKRLVKPIDESILADLLEFRELLSKDLKSKRNYLEDSQIDEIVQILIDRLIFMRSVEDRGLEAKDFLLIIIKDVEQGRIDMNLWGVLKAQFKRFDNTYNSKLFQEGVLEKEGFFDNKILAKVIRGLYYGISYHQERYMFDEIPVDLLGSIYEQYLGVVLRGTEKRVKFDLQSGKRKKMGIYYTPSYIVEYIVKNTLGEYVKDKSLDEILKIKIVDPACGSGSFLIKAFSEMCGIVEERLKKGEKSKEYLSFQKWNGKLSLGEKKQILLNCIYGVDLDEKAVELARLNLLLKCLEEETRETKSKRLPNLSENIRNGNSLISDSRYDKAFNWNAQFKDVFAEGGFDVVVGNPPYVDYSKIKGTEYFNKNFESSNVNGKVVKYNLFQLFIEKSINLLKENGMFGFINPNTYLSTENAFALRKLILEKTSLKKIIDVSHLNVFKDASTYPVITIFKKGKTKENSLGVASVENENEIVPNMKLNEIEQESFEEDKNLNFMIGSNKENKEIISKLDSYEKLNDFSETFVWGSSITGFATHKAKEKDNDKKYSPVIQTRDIKKYNIEWKEEYIENKIYSDKLKELFKQKKIVIARVTKGVQATIDDKGFYVGKSSILIPKDKNNFEILLAILNSKLINYYYKMKFETTHMAGGYIRFDIPYLKNLPIKIPNEKQSAKIKELVERIMEFYKEGKSEQDIKNVDYEIDEEVYRLYGVNEEEKRVIEGWIK
ncbi:N-6 DNA methylase [Candidatus Pacearchaeota archaeon]|nr:N-6 DNA methylase [Candidatus Pacearchaeota archaeon]